MQQIDNAPWPRCPEWSRSLLDRSKYVSLRLLLPKTVRRLHWPLRDPANVKGTEEEQLQAFRNVRDELDRKLGELWSADGVDG